MKRKAVDKRLDGRRADFSRMTAGGVHEAKVAARIHSGGFHRPGSYKK